MCLKLIAVGAEEPLPAGGSCLLGSFNFSEYVNNPFTKNASFDFKQFIEDIKKVVVFMNEILDEGLKLHPLQEQRDSVRDWRQIGIGYMGLADMLIKLGIKYGSEKSMLICNQIGFTLINNAIKQSSLLAKKFGVYPKYNKKVLKSQFFNSNTSDETKELVKQYGLRNSQLLTCAPTGSLSTMLGISGGGEPIYQISYNRKTESLHGKDKYYTIYTPIVKEYMELKGLTDEKELPDYFITSMKLNYQDRINMQSVWQQYVDASISSTINVPEYFSVDQVKDLYIYSWEKGLKGVTIYRNNCERSGILTTNENNKNTVDEFPRGIIEEVPEGLTYRKYKLHTGCGRLYFFLGVDEYDSKIYDCFCNTDGVSGCNINTQAVSRLLSAGLRSGIPIDYLVKQLDKAGVCPSYQYRRGKGEYLSQGKSCASSIGNVIKGVLKEFADSDNEKNKQSELKDTNGKICPDCGEQLIAESGCFSCGNCGFSFCS